MAKARPNPKRRRIVIVKPEEDKGDLQISRGEAKLRLTPKLFLTLGLLIAAAVAIVIVAVRYSGQQGAFLTPGGASNTAPGDQASLTPGANHPPQVIDAAIIPANPTAGTALDVKYQAIDRDGDAVAYTFKWYVNSDLVQDGPSSALPPGSYRNGDEVYVEVTAADQAEAGLAFKTEAVTIGAAAPAAGSVTLSPEKASIGDVLTAKTAVAESGSGMASFRYQWYVNGDAVGGPSSENTFDTRNLKKRDSVSVAAIAADGASSGGSVRSGMVFMQNRKPEIVSSAPETVEGGTYTYQVAAKDPDGDTLTYRLELAPAGMTINETSGLIQWSLKKATMYAGRNEATVRVTVDDGDGGTASQDFTIVFTDLFVQ